MEEKITSRHKNQRITKMNWSLYLLLSMIITAVKSQWEGDVYPIVHGGYFSQFGNISSQDYSFVPGKYLEKQNIFLVNYNKIKCLYFKNSKYISRIINWMSVRLLTKYWINKISYHEESSKILILNKLASMYTIFWEYSK